MLTRRNLLKFLATGFVRPWLLNSPGPLWQSAGSCGGGVGVEGHFSHFRHHFYWRTLDNGDIAIVTILHERMHQLSRFNEAQGEDG